MLSINFAMYYPTLYLQRAVILHDTFNNAVKMLTIRSALCYGMFRTCLAHESNRRPVDSISHSFAFSCRSVLSEEGYEYDYDNMSEDIAHDRTESIWSNVSGGQIQSCI